MALGEFRMRKIPEKFLSQTTDFQRSLGEREKAMWKYSRIISHRGGGYLAPENTISAMAIAYHFQKLAVEFDVMLSRDSVPIIMHDDVLGRTVPGTGNISDLTADELLQLDAGSWWNNLLVKLENNDPVILAAFPNLNVAEVLYVINTLPKRFYPDEKVPSFVSLGDYCKSHNIWMNIEIKPAPGFDRQTGEIVAQTTKEMFQNELASDPIDYTRIPLFSSFSYDSLVSAKEVAPEIPRSYLTEIIPPNWREILTELDSQNIHCDHKYLTKELVAEIKSAGYCIACYTVNDMTRAEELFGWGVDAIFTDRVDLWASK